MNEYLRNMFIAFRFKKGVDYDLTKLSTEEYKEINQEFREWLYSLQDYQVVYAKFLAGLVLTDKESKGIIELNKGILDSILGGLEAAGIEKTVAITGYSSTFNKDYLKNHGLKGFAGLNHYQPYINCNIQEFLNIEKTKNDKTVFPTLTYQLTPNSGWPGIYTIKEIVEDYGKTVVIGAYGSKSDKDIEMRYDTLVSVYEQAKKHGMEARMYSYDDYPFFHEDYEVANDLEGYSYNKAVKILSKKRNN